MVALLTGTQASTGSRRSLIQRIRALLQELHEYCVTHICREGNACADILASMDCESRRGMIVYEQAHAPVGQALRKDLLSLSTPCLVPV